MTFSIKARLNLFKTWKECHPATGLDGFRSAFKKPGCRTQFGTGAAGNWDPEKRGIYYFHSMPDDYRPKKADDVTRLGHNGWYSDNHQDGLYVPYVFQLPSNRNGLNRDNALDLEERLHHFPGYLDNCSGRVVVDFFDGYMTPQEAARAADSMAEGDAEESREYYAKDSAEQDIDQARQEIHAINQKALELRKNSCRGGKPFDVHPVIAEAVDLTRRAYIERRAKQHKIIRDRQNDYWTAVPSY